MYYHVGTMIVMTRSGVRLIARWTLLCALLLGVVAMHHVVAAHGPGHGVMPVMAAAPQAVAEPIADESGASPDGMLHLCLAVLFAFAAAALTVLVLRSRFGSGARAAGVALSLAFARAPPPVAGREILHLACVLRI